MGYLLRIPSHGGHWITLLPGRALNFNPAHPHLRGDSETPAALLCDLLYPCPHVVSKEDVELLLMTCAIDIASLHPYHFQGSWGCFLIGLDHSS